MRLIFARCLVLYSGRIDAELELGDRLIIRKDDGAVIVHACAGLKEKNWMPSGSSWSEDEHLIVSEHPRHGERLEIFLEHIHSASDHVGELHGRLIKLGREHDFSDLLAADITRVAPGLVVIGREVRTPAGPIDILCRDQDGWLVAIEVKRNRGVGKETGYQVIRYLDALKTMPAWKNVPCRGLLVAPGLSKGTLELLGQLEIGYVRLGYESIAPKPTSGTSALGELLGDQLTDDND